MPEKSQVKTRAAIKGSRSYEAESQRLLSLRLIAAPNPKDDLSDAELEAMCKDPRHSPELIQQLIEFVKGM
jgi:hypothetical protein